MDFEIGDEPDYQLRAGIYNDDTAFILAYSGSGNTLNQEVPNSLNTDQSQSEVAAGATPTETKS